MTGLPLSFTPFTSSLVVMQPDAASVAAFFTCGKHLHQTGPANAGITSLHPVEYPFESWDPRWDATGINDGVVLGDQCAIGHNLAPPRPDAAGKSLMSRHHGPTSIYPPGLTSNLLALAASGCLIHAQFDAPVWSKASSPGNPITTHTDLTSNRVFEALLGQMGQPYNSTTTTPPKCSFDLGSTCERVFVRTAMGGKRRHPSDTNSPTSAYTNSPTSSDTTSTTSTSSSQNRAPKHKRHKAQRAVPKVTRARSPTQHLSPKW